jgi:hypothetical protein
VFTELEIGLISSFIFQENGVCVREFLLNVITGSGRKIQIATGEIETRDGETGGKFPHQRQSRAETSQKITNI